MNHALSENWILDPASSVTYATAPRPPSSPTSPTLREAIGAVLEAKRVGGLRDNSIKSLRMYLDQFARGRSDMPIADVRASHIETWLDSSPYQPNSKKTMVNKLSSLFSFAERRDWIIANPCRKVERIRHDQKPPTILTLRQAAKLLGASRRRHPQTLAYLTLTMLAGCRPSELRGIKWSDVDLVRGIVRVSEATCKTRRRRYVYMEPSAIAWLSVAMERRSMLPVCDQTRINYVKTLRSVLKMERWPADVLRHTCASYWYALREDAGFVAKQLGNSPATLLRHYYSMVRKEDAEKFWSFRPKERPVYRNLISLRKKQQCMAKARARRWASLPVKDCVICGAMFQAHTWNVIACSAECRLKHKRAYDRRWIAGCPDHQIKQLQRWVARAQAKAS